MMKNLMVLWFVLLSTIVPLGDCREVQSQKPKNYIVTNSRGESKNITIVNGKSIHFAFEAACKDLNISKYNCRNYAAFTSANYYEVYYSPSRETSTIEDFYAKRTDILKYLQLRFGYSSYLEIGCQGNLNFNQMKDLFETYVGVDPDQGGTLRMTSDEFFLQNEQHFDLIFIDGDHTAEQVWKDIVNSLNVLNEGGSVVLHDLNPALEAQQTPFDPSSTNPVWNGDCWRAAVAARLLKDYEIIVVDVDHGCGIIRKRPNTHPLPEKLQQALLQIGSLPGQTLPGAHSLSFQDFDSNRETLFRLMTLVEMREWLEEK